MTSLTRLLNAALGISRGVRASPLRAGGSVAVRAWWPGGVSCFSISVLEPTADGLRHQDALRSWITWVAATLRIGLRSIDSLRHRGNKHENDRRASKYRKKLRNVTGSSTLVTNNDRSNGTLKETVLQEFRALATGRAADVYPDDGTETSDRAEISVGKVR